MRKSPEKRYFKHLEERTVGALGCGLVFLLFIGVLTLLGMLKDWFFAE